MFYALSGLINAITSIALGGFVYFKNRKAALNRSFTLFAFAVGVWSFGYFYWQISIDPQSALFWSRVLMAGAIFIPICYFHFILSLLDLRQEKKRLLIFGYILSFVFFISNFTSLFVKGVAPKLSFSYWPEPGVIFSLFLLMFFGCVIYSWCLMLKGLKECTGIKCTQIKYVLIGTLIGFLGGSTNYFLWYNFPVPPFCNILVSVYVVLMAYAIVKKELFDIKVVLTAFLVGLIAVLLSIDALVFTENLYFQIIKGGILIIFLYFGYLLIRSVLREIHYREEIKRAYDVEKKARGELERLSEAKTQFLMAVQHHLRTPLTVMRGYLDLIFGGTYGKVPPKIKNALLKFQISNKRLIKVVNELLDISQFQLGKKVVSLQSGVEIEPILKEIIEELQFEAKARGLYLRFQKPAEIPKIKADPEKLNVALSNIIDNAIKYTSKGGVIINIKYQISNIKNKSKLQIIVKDTGVGIPKENLETLFARTFERGKEARKVHGTGRGIGLYITGHIVKAHNGKIWAESEGKGKGSTFYVELPI